VHELLNDHDRGDCHDQANQMETRPFLHVGPASLASTWSHAAGGRVEHVVPDRRATAYICTRRL
jgi:hypothetical protein